VIYTITNSSIPGVPGTLQFGTGGAGPLQVTGQSGVSNSVGQWNLPGSQAVAGPYTDTFGGANPATIAAPVIPAVVAPLGTTSITPTGPAGSTVTLYGLNGNVLGSGLAGTAITTSSTVLPSTPLLATDTLGGVGNVSQAAFEVGVSPLPISSTGSLSGGTNVNVTLSTLPGLTENLAFAAGAETTAGTAKVGVTALGAAANFVVGSTGQIIVVFTAGSGGTAANTDTLSTKDSGATGTTLASDTYTY
jgi:hypothetical protein